MITKNHAEQIIRFLDVQPGESIALVGDNSSQEIIQPLVKILDKTNHLDYVNIDKYKRPLEKIPENLANIIKEKDLCFYALDKKANDQIDEGVFRTSLCNLVEEFGGRVGNMISVTPKVIESAFNCNPDKIRDLTRRLNDYMELVSNVKVTSDDGTDAIFSFDSCYRWVMSTGFIQKGKAKNVMPAELYTHPSKVDGKIVIAGPYGYTGYLPQFKNTKENLSKIAKNPVSWIVKDGIIKDVLCDDKDIKSIVQKRVFESEENADIIGEYGMGTNTAITKFLGVMIHDEKFPGVHVAHGYGFPKQTGAKYDCDIHHDVILTKPTVKNLDNNKFIMREGKYVF